MPVESGRTAPTGIRLLSLRDDALVEVDDETAVLRVLTRWGEIVVDDAPPRVRELLTRMTMGPVSVRNVFPAGAMAGRDTEDAAGSRDVAELRRVLDLLRGSVVHTLSLDDGGGSLLSAIPVAARADIRLAEIDPYRPVRLSRFATIRTSGTGLVVECPLSQYQVVLHRGLATRLVATLGTAISVAGLADTLRLPRALVADVVVYLVATGVAVLGAAGSSGARFDEDTDRVLVRWSHHDLMFHSHSRMERSGGASGPMVPHADEPAPPVTRPVPPGPRLPLPTPAGTTGTTIRAAPGPAAGTGAPCPYRADLLVTAEQVGELLFRAARIHSVGVSTTLAGTEYETSRRPYLGARGLYDLELYVTLDNCAGLPPAIYHYDPRAHVLTLINDSAADRAELLDIAKVAAGRTEPPPMLITVTARLERLSWMFGGIAYAMSLMQLGALQQTLHLVAGDMGMVACALTLDTTAVTECALGVHWPAEVGLGECVIGCRA